MSGRQDGEKQNNLSDFEVVSSLDIGYAEMEQLMKYTICRHAVLSDILLQYSSQVVVRLKGGKGCKLKPNIYITGYIIPLTFLKQDNGSLRNMTSGILSRPFTSCESVLIVFYVTF